MNAFTETGRLAAGRRRSTASRTSSSSTRRSSGSSSSGSPRGARHATPTRSRARSTSCARRRRGTDEPHARRPSRSPVPAAPSASGPARCATCSASTARPPVSAACTRRSGDAMERRASGSHARAEALGHPIRILVGKPGLDGHSNGAEQIAVAARDAGMEVIYQGIRLTPEQIAAAARDEDVDLVGLSVLSGSHRELVPETRRGCCGPTASTRRSSSAASSPRPTSAELLAAGRGPRLHAQGLPRHRDRRRARRPGDRPIVMRAADARQRRRLPRRRRVRGPAPSSRSSIGGDRGRRRRGGARARRRGRRCGRRRRRRADRRAPDPRRGLAARGARRRPDASAASSSRCRSRWPRSSALADRRPTPADLPTGTDTDDWEIDPVSGLLRERHLPVLLQQVVAAARRKVQPVSVVFWELDGLDQAPPRGTRRRRSPRSAPSPGARCARATRCSASATSPRSPCSSTPPSRARSSSPSRVREALRIEPGRRLAHRVGRDRVLPDPRARRRRARRTRRARARAGHATTGHERDHVASPIPADRGRRQRRRARRSPSRTSRRSPRRLSFIVGVSSSESGSHSSASTREPPDLLRVREPLVGLGDLALDLGQHHRIDGELGQRRCR